MCRLDLDTKAEMRKHKRKNIVYVDFIDLEKAYDRVNLGKLCGR